MYFVQYYQRGLISGDLIEACGDRAVVVLDGRRALETLRRHAREENGHRRPRYEAFRLYKGRNFLDSAPITEIEHLTEVE